MSESVLDAGNRYRSTVKITTLFEGSKGAGFRTCSGVVIHPRLVLTAGHCVCLRHPSATSKERGSFVVDASRCVKTANITILLYRPLSEKERALLTSELDWPSEARSSTGQVRPHPGLEIHYLNETDNRELSSNADLAVIRLDEPLDGRIPPVSFAREEVSIAEPVTIVGYGLARPTERSSRGARRVGTNEIASLEETGGKTFRIAKPLLIPATFAQGESLLMREMASYALSGDSGGPCFRERDESLELVGIAKTSHSVPVEYTEYTSTHFYRDWIRGELERARKAGSSQPTD
ncbi:MAG: trypsin-like serine protease [Myxococcaceae bacterium]|nr:trypsin-like serine protease [Myxococcaceae bacterium]